MSGTIESLTRKISGAADLEAVVRSMKALAASSIGQYQKAVHSLDEYATTVELALTRAFGRLDQATTRQKQDHKRSTASEQLSLARTRDSLDGSMNWSWNMPSKRSKLCPAQSRRYGLSENAFTPFWPIPECRQPDLARASVGQCHCRARRADSDRCRISARARRSGGGISVPQPPKSGSVYDPVGKRLLPLDLAWQKQLAAAPWPTKLPPEVIQGTTSPLRAFIREYLFVLLFQACAESLASENASRLAAMQRAEKNIDGILEDLNLKLHRIRQESIDEELFDVISGYEALTAVRRPR